MVVTMSGMLQILAPSAVNNSKNMILNCVKNSMIKDFYSFASPSSIILFFLIHENIYNIYFNKLDLKMIFQLIFIRQL